LAVENVVLQTRVDDLEGQVGALAEKVSVLARLAFGTSSEKAKQAPDGGGGGGGGQFHQPHPVWELCAPLLRRPSPTGSSRRHRDR
jgi:hypothetical protein